MSTLTAGATLLEMAKQIAPDGSQMRIAEYMAKKTSLFLDMPFFPSNDIWSHKSLRQAKLSGGTWRGLNEYVAPGITLTDEIMDIIGIIEDFAVYDKLYIDRQPDPEMARLGKARMHIEGMSQEICSAFLYGNNKVTPKKPHGIMSRLNTLGRYVIGNGGTGNDTASCIVVTWGENQCFGVFPKTGQSPKGEFPVTHKSTTGPEGRVDTNSSGNKLIIYEDNFKFEGGFVVADPRCLGRLANIETTKGSPNTFDEDNLIELVGNMETNEKTVIYANETIITQMRIRMKDKANIYFTPSKGQGLFGEPVLYFDGFPIRKIDSAIMLNTESAIA